MATMPPTSTTLDAEIAEALATDRPRPRDELVRVANAAAAMVFAGKSKLTDAMRARARSAAFKAIQQHDRIAGTSYHPHAAYSHGIATLANQGLEQAIAGWQEVQRIGGATGVRRKYGLR